MKNSKLFSFMFILLFFMSFTYSMTYLSEIDFRKDYVEIFSNESLNLSQGSIFDKSGILNKRDLSQIKTISSNFYLIVDSDFKNLYNLNNLNCNIYETNNPVLTHSGLDNNGENVTILINSTFNLTYSHPQTTSYNFQNNQSLNFNNQTNQWIISNSTICASNIFPQTINTNSKCGFDFSINSENYFVDKILFSFGTILTSYNITYWIETFEGNIVKNKLITKNTNQKQYTPPDYVNLYKIKAEITNGTCFEQTEKNVSFYSPNKQIQYNTKTKYVEKEEEMLHQNSYIKILNEKEIKNFEDEFIEYEIYKSDDTRKYSINVFLEKEKINTFYILKNQIQKGRIFLGDVSDIENIKIEGLDITKTIELDLKEKEKIKEIGKNTSSKRKKTFEIENLKLENNKINFEILSDYPNTQFQCYVSVGRTTLSDKIKEVIEKPKYEFFLIIDEKKVYEKSKEKETQLKLLCKYKKNTSKGFTYKSKLFNFKQNLQFEQIAFENKSIEKILNFKNVEEKVLDVEEKKISKIKEIVNEFNINKEEENLIISNENQTNQTTFLSLLFGMFLILSIMLIKW